MPQIQQFNNFIEHGKIKPDEMQLQAILQLEKIHHALVKNEINSNKKHVPDHSEKKGFFSSLFKSDKSTTKTSQSKTIIKGMYIWGDVGRGKTWLMDQLYASLTIERKQRIHFHEFMLQVHERLENLPTQPDPLEIIGYDMSVKYQLICLDEFHVMDIADAVILHGLLRSLFDHGVTLITTSNRFPDELYKDGSRRERFLPAIELIKENTHVFHLDSGKDYRLKRERRENTFFTPHDEMVNNKLSKLFKQYTNGETPSKDAIKIGGRNIAVVQSASTFIWFNFDTLCRGMRASSDYVAIASQYKLIILSEIPILKEGEEGPARRFLNLIDAFYDQQVLLLLSSSSEIINMYQGNLLGFEFERALSRLDEMQSQSWWQTFDEKGLMKNA